MRIIVLIYYSTYIVSILPIGPCMHPLFENKNSYMHACNTESSHHSTKTCMCSYTYIIHKEANY